MNGPVDREIVVALTYAEFGYIEGRILHDEAEQAQSIRRKLAEAAGDEP